MTKYLLIKKTNVVVEEEFGLKNVLSNFNIIAESKDFVKLETKMNYLRSQVKFGNRYQDSYYIQEVEEI